MLALLLLPLVAQAAFVTVPWPTPSKKSLNLTMGYATVTKTGTRFNWYIAVLDDLSRYSQRLPHNTCAMRATTTATANEHTCAVASNSGYFQFSPRPTYCTGNLVTGGQVQLWTSDDLPMLAVTSNSTLLGSIPRAQLAALGVTHAVSGSGLIQAQGQPSAEGIARARAHILALRPTAEEVAPRTILCVDAAGRLLLLTIDGVEALNLGVTLDEAADIVSGGAPGLPFVSLHAINLDGGGSTTLSAAPFAGAPAQVYNRPTDSDTGPVTERAVTSIVCIV
jgi:hypothetical protein